MPLSSTWVAHGWCIGGALVQDAFGLVSSSPSRILSKFPRCCVVFSKGILVIFLYPLWLSN
jgi:hypothetical protein